MMSSKDTTPILNQQHQEDVDLEAGDVFPHLLVVPRPRPSPHHHHNASAAFPSYIAASKAGRKDGGSGDRAPDMAFRLRMVALITIASLALLTIVLISEQLISRHLATTSSGAIGGQILEDHVILEVEMPPNPPVTELKGFTEDFLEGAGREDGSKAGFDVQMHEEFPSQEEISIISQEGVQVVKQTTLNFHDENEFPAPEDNLIHDDDLIINHHLDDQEDIFNNDEDYYSEEDEYDDDSDEYDSDEYDYDDDEYLDDNDDSYDDDENPTPEDFLDALQSEVISDNLSEDKIERIKALLNAHNGDESKLPW
eukprot:TRINITY_DN14173_c0_g1_i2.p1 TRINITY_DN14173_c0_g1~~TRINITY_DN14173_c0_g1_i2.p1  ORF type:complete len:311 (-),score=112.52 TRINITY_DN14173_c0_g1_i2:343-1275(-)